MLRIRQIATKENAIFVEEPLKESLMANGYAQTVVSGMTNYLKGDNND